MLRFLTQLNFYSPLNLRKILKVRPGRNTTAMALLTGISVRMHRLTGKPIHLSDALFTGDWLLEKAAETGPGSIGWTREIEYQSSRSTRHTSVRTLTFINSLAIKALVELYRETGKPEYLDAASKAGRHLVEVTPRIVYPYGVCLSYTDEEKHEILNASILAGGALSFLCSFKPSDRARDLSLDILRYAIHVQNADGSWHYSRKFGKPFKRQFDFHQCYVIEGISDYEGLSGDISNSAKDAVQKGLDFYVSTLLDHKMRPYWRYPKKYPIDIHNVSHGLSLLIRHRRDLQESSRMIKGILGILINDFYSPFSGRFYYQRYPHLTVRHQFIRWNDCWSLVSLCDLLEAMELGDLV